MRVHVRERQRSTIQTLAGKQAAGRQGDRPLPDVSEGDEASRLDRIQKKTDKEAASGCPVQASGQEDSSTQMS